MTQQFPPNSKREIDASQQNALGLLRLLVTVLLIAGVSLAFNKGAATLVVLAILVMIMLHEVGHFVTARWAGMKVTDFFVGFGPILWSTQRGETRYGVRALPLGGYVRVIGMSNLEEVAPEDEPRTYRAKRYWQRLRFAVAGTTMHFIIAFVLMIVLLAGFGRVVDTVPTTGINAVAAESNGAPSPAKAAGIHKGDKIVAINGHAVTKWSEVSKAIHASPNTRIALTIERAAKTIDLSVVPQATEDAHGQTIGVIGIQSGTRDIRKTVSWPVAVWQAPFEIKSMTFDSVRALGGLVTKSNVENYGHQLTKTGPVQPQVMNKDGNRLLSIFGLFRIADFITHKGIAAVLSLLIGLNIFVGIFNMIPLPPFDGGHVAVATYEAIVGRFKGRRHIIDMNKMLPLAYAMVVLLVLLSLSAAWLDLRHPFNLG